jgi:hypothetical protein
MQQAIEIASRRADLVLTDKPVYRDQALADGIDGEEKTFESYGAKQGWTLWRNKAWSRDCIAIQSQPCFGYGPDVSLSARDHDALRAGGFQLKPFRQRLWHHAKRSASVYKKLNFFNMSRRTGQMALYVEQSHIKSLLKNTAIVAQPTNNATTLIRLQTRRSPGGAAEEVRVHHQPKSSEADRISNTAKCSGKSRSSNPMTANLQPVLSYVEGSAIQNRKS